VEGKGRKEGEGGWTAANHWLTDHASPPLNPYFHPPLYLAPIMLTLLTKSIKSLGFGIMLLLRWILLFFYADFTGCGIDPKSTSDTCHFHKSSLICWSSGK
jgi:hypothetical protein